jgi:hypothetical protein
MNPHLWLVAVGLVSLAGCAHRAVPCDAHLEPINAPAPRVTVPAKLGVIPSAKATDSTDAKL